MLPDAIDHDQVRRVARLARLKLSDDEVRLLTGQLGQILSYFKQIAAVDTTGVEPLSHPLPPTETLREDEPGPPFGVDRALRNAPRLSDRLFVVPAVIDRPSDT